jgi:N-acetylmuramic acid 6-phosphate etherase
MTELAHLLTEAHNPATAELDRLSTMELVRVMHAQDADVLVAVDSELGAIARAIDAIVARLDHGGRLFYIGAGTSGRLGVLDASECAPTFDTPPDLVQAIMAGGDVALRQSIEGAEDDAAQGAADLTAHGFATADALVAIAASGRTPYALGAAGYARSLGALTIALSCVSDSELAQVCELALTPLVGAEVISGSTRMKSGTATKIVLNMLSTGSMVRLGYVYGNLMVNVQPSNEKLRARAVRIVSTLTGLPYHGAEKLLGDAGSVKTAVVMHRLAVSRASAEDRLAGSKGRLRVALGETENDDVESANG